VYVCVKNISACSAVSEKNSAVQFSGELGILGPDSTVEIPNPRSTPYLTESERPQFRIEGDIGNNLN
jgi:hypothetical protein